MTDLGVTPFRERFRELEQRLDGSPAGPDRERLKRDIIEFFKRVDGALAELGQVKEEIRGLVDRYKQLGNAAEGPQAPQFTGQRPAVQADHLNASSFIEKGWSLISLGDYAGAIQSLEKALALSPGATQALSLIHI